MRNSLDPTEHDDRTYCEKCGAYDLEPDQPCDCLDEEEDTLTEGVPLGDVAPYSRDEFYEMLGEDPQYSGLVDPEDFEIQLIATVLSLDAKIQVLLKAKGSGT